MATARSSPSCASGIAGSTPFGPRRTSPSGKVDQKIPAPAVGVDRHGDHRCHRDDPTAVANLQAGRSQPGIGPFAFARPLQEGTRALVDLLAQLGELGPADAGKTHRPDQLVDAAGRDPGDPSLLDHRHQHLLARLLRLEERREAAALPKLGNAQLQLAQTGVEGPVPLAVSVVQPLRRALVPPGTDRPLHIALRQDLQHRFGHGAQEVAVTGLLQQPGQWQAVVGHRLLRRFGVKHRNSTLTVEADDHLPPRVARPRQPGGGRAGAPRAPDFHQLHGR